jgi:hypothetical protein
MAADPTRLERARTILRDYWGTSGPDRVLRRGDVRKLKLTKNEIEDLLDDLPPPGAVGDISQRVAECYRFLERL